MPLNPTNMKQYLYLYGNNSIRNDRFLIGQADNENASPVEVQTQTLARGSGSRPTNARTRAKEIKIKGEIANLDLSLATVEGLTQKLNKIYSQQYRTLRVMPSYITLSDSSMSAQWTASDDAQNIAEDATEYQFGNKSIKFDVSVAASGNNYATLIGNLTTPQDISSLIGKGSIDFWLEIPDVYFVTSIEFRIGSDSSNYWDYTFTNNYENKKLENGVNYFSCPFSSSGVAPAFSNRMGVNGSPNFAVTDYVWIRINYSSSAVNISNCRFGEVFAVDESLVRNYVCYRQGNVGISRNYDYSRRVRKYEVSLINYTGYGQATHSEVLYYNATVSGLSNTFTLNFKGDDPHPKITMTLLNSTNLDKLKITNLNNSNIVSFQNTWINGDIITLDKMAEIDAEGRQPVTKNNLPQDFVGKIPEFESGINRLNFGVDLATIVNYTSSTSNTNYTPAYDPTGTFATDTWAGQSFTTPAFTCFLNGLFWLNLFTVGSPNFDFRLYAHDVGNNRPSTLLATFTRTVTASGFDDPALGFSFSFTTSLSASTKYWVITNTRNSAYSGPSPYYNFASHDINSINSGNNIPNGNYGYGVPGGAWTNQNTWDAKCKLTLSASSANQYILKIEDKKLYF